MKLAESFDPVSERPLLERELRRIRRMSDEGGTQQDGYFDWLQRQALALKMETHVREELRQAWANGAGKISAGIALCMLESTISSDAEATLTQLLKRRDLTMPSIDRLSGAFEAAGKSEWLARAQARGVEMNAMDDNRLIAWIRTLHKTYGKERAQAAFDRWSARFWLSEDSAALAGEMYAELGASDKAEALLLHAIRHDPYGRNPQARVQLARLKRQQGDLSSALPLLIAAYRSPEQQDLAELVEWLSASGKLASYVKQLGTFGLSEYQMLLFRQALWSHFVLQRNAPAAYALLSEHPAIYSSKLSAQLRELAQATQTFAQASSFLEGIRDGKEHPSDLDSDLARVLFDWSEAEGSGDLSRLQRATELDPTFHDAVMRLARGYVAQSKRQEAGRLLETFLAISTNQKERESARALLRETKGATGGI
ncbi:MAG: hypothetical protein EON93_16625 [Burkholderiales bacterium]|nr:MAG: hypothetical protein EON93_16625 [Burkholderiales bacterium]